ncbi:MAG: aminotransferase class V-fold PLP-dependent enzyme [Alphaproteobacteria bacterium]|nr:aminotransferase class V-fold PLP-dependent enzyme [Alphaproteobacteria bacterium]
MTLQCQRHLFDMPQETCYLNASYMTPLLLSQMEAGKQALVQGCHPWEIEAQDFFTAPGEVCREGARIMNVSPDDVAIVPSASYGISTAAKNLPLSSGGMILVMAEEFPSNHYAWQAKAEACGGSVLPVPTPPDHDWTSAILETMAEKGEQIEIVALANVHWSSGAVLDLVAISKECKRFGAALVLDLSQSLGAMPIDIAAIDPDFMVSAGYKWLLAPYGISLMYAAPRWQQGVPIEEGWITREGSEDFSALVNYQYKFQRGAKRYEMGERANLLLAPVFLAALKQINEWSVPAIYDYVRRLTQRLADLAEGMGYRPIAPEFRSGHILGINVGAHGPATLAALKAGGVSCSLRGSMLRLSPHLWVNELDIDRFGQVLPKAVSF